VAVRASTFVFNLIVKGVWPKVGEILFTMEDGKVDSGEQLEVFSVEHRPGRTGLQLFLSSQCLSLKAERWKDRERERERERGRETKIGFLVS
jgi:hypothetical protein